MAGGESRFVDCGGVELHIRVWGGGESSPARPPVVLWHGLTRNGGDFAPLARGLTAAGDDGFLLFAPDSPGRGFSQWLPAAPDYAFDALPALAAKMLRALEIEECDWVGTSMGGILGLRLAAVEWRGKIRRLLINDIGAGISAGRDRSHSSIRRRGAALCDDGGIGAPRARDLQAVRGAFGFRMARFRRQCRPPRRRRLL